MTKCTHSNKDNMLLISNSTSAGGAYLVHAMPEIERHLAGAKTVAFIPYAAVRMSYDDYEAKVQKAFDAIAVKVQSVHHAENPVAFLEKAEAVAVGGGNTFQLLHMIKQNNLLDPLKKIASTGCIPYMGWSAGTNVLCPTVGTTNDMPIADLQGIGAIDALCFQINPHYINHIIEGHNGETRDERIEEFITLYPNLPVLGLREGTMLRFLNGKGELIGDKPARWFQHGKEPIEIQPGDVSSLLHTRNTCKA